jgi:putative hydrolase
VSAIGPSGQGGFFERLLDDLVQMMGNAGTGAGPRIEMARSFAHQVAAGTATEPNVDPTERIRLEELARVAELHIAEITGLSTTPSGSPVEIIALGPGAWAWQTVEDWQFLLAPASDDIGAGAGFPGAGAGLPGAGPPGATGLGATGLGLDQFAGDPAGFGDEDSAGGEDFLNRIMGTMGPMLASMQLGSAVGHLARSTMGAYDLPVPRLVGSRLLLVPANISRFAEDWGLQLDEVRLWVCLRELTVHAVVVRPHVAERLRALLSDFMHGASQDLSGLAGMLGGIDPSDPDSIREIVDNPGSLLEVELSPERARIARDLAAITSPLAGYVEWVLDRTGERLLGDRRLLSEAWRRHQVEGRAQLSGTEAFLGLDTSAAEAERGSDFVKGVLERAGTEGLARLWESAETLPTPAEVDAPGLWLERLKLQDPSPDS